MTAKDTIEIGSLTMHRDADCSRYAGRAGELTVSAIRMGTGWYARAMARQYVAEGEGRTATEATQRAVGPESRWEAKR